jgi:hypothetical protein
MSNSLKTITAAAAALCAGAAFAAGPVVDVVKRFLDEPGLRPVASITACAKGSLVQMERTFEDATTAEAVAALEEKPKGACWERLGELGNDGYSSGAGVEVVRTAPLQASSDGYGTVTRYDVVVGGRTVGSVLRVITTTSPLTYGFGVAIRSGKLSKSLPFSTVVRLEDGSTVRVDDQVAPVGTKVHVLVDYVGGKRTFSLSKDGT